MSYSSAWQYCKSLDDRAHLAEIRTADIQKFIEKNVKNAPHKEVIFIS